MNPIQTDNKGRSYIAKGGSIPQTTLKIPMPAGAKSPPAAPAANPQPSRSQKGK
jgi:hypothetical protein